MKRRWELVHGCLEVLEPEITRVFRETSLRSEITPLRCREGWEFSSGTLNTFVVDVALVEKKAYDQDEMFLLEIEELL